MNPLHAELQKIPKKNNFAHLKKNVSLWELNASIRKLRNKLKNDYFSGLASNINFAREARAVEEEFRLCKEYRINKPKKKMVISNETLATFFEDHFKEKEVELQPEVINPDNFPIFYHQIS